MKKTKKPLRVNNIDELREVRRGTVAEIPQVSGGFVQGVFRRIEGSEACLFARSKDSNKVYESFYYSDSNGNFPYDSIPQGDTTVYPIKSWKGRRINRVLRRNGL